MITNPSTKQKTLKSFTQMLPADVWSDYNLIKYLSQDSYSFPDRFMIDDYYDYFTENDFIEEIELDKKFYYSPAAFAEYYYGTVDLDFLVMYFNNITSIFEFNTKKIKVLKPERLTDINKIIVKHKDECRESRE